MDNNLDDNLIVVIIIIIIIQDGLFIHSHHSGWQQLSRFLV